MRSIDALQMSRRRLLRSGAAAAALGSLAACAQASPIYALAVSRDAGCVCCHAWMTSLTASGRFRAEMRDEPDMAALKRRLGVPADLVSCHTAQVENYVIEGHVPAADVLRLLDERPARMRGLAVAGMPIGAPGMEQPDGARQAFVVSAFAADGTRSVFARHD